MSFAERSVALASMWMNLRSAGSCRSSSMQASGWSCQVRCHYVVV